MTVADSERRRLENNLHDGAQLTLTMLAGQLATAREESRRNPDLAPGLFEDAETHLLIAIDELRDLAHGIHPTILTDLGLAEAIRSLTDGSPVPIRLLELPAGRLDPTAEATAYYVVAEALDERAAPRPREDDHDPRHRVRALPADRGRRRRRRRARTNGSARASRACGTGSRPWAACSAWRALPAAGRWFAPTFRSSLEIDPAGSSRASPATDRVET